MASSLKNLFKVVDSRHLDEMLQKHGNRLTMVVFMQDWADICKTHKQLIKQVAKVYPAMYFAIINTDEFKDQQMKYLGNLSGVIPDYRFFNMQKQVAFVGGPDFERVRRLIPMLFSRWKQMMAQSVPPSQQPVEQPTETPATRGNTRPTKEAHDHNDDAASSTSTSHSSTNTGGVKPSNVPSQMVPTSPVPVQSNTEPATGKDNVGDLMKLNQEKQQEINQLQQQLSRLQMYRKKQQDTLLLQMGMYKKLYRAKKKQEAEDPQSSSSESSEYSDSD